MNGNAREFQLQTIRELDRIAVAHLQWLHGYHRALLCGEAATAEIMAPDAHDACTFGVWYRQLELDPDNCRPWTSQVRHIAGLHRKMHESAAELARNAADRNVAGVAYDGFAEYAFRFKTGLRALQMKLVRDVCLIDHLTGVWNRSSLLQRLAEEAERMNRYGGTCCLCMMDIDHFKVINDRFGHAAGDRVLQRVVAVAQQRLRRFDSIFRYGGEEFLICLPRSSVPEAAATMERIRADVVAVALGIDEAPEARVTASFGVAELRLAPGVEESIEDADRALFMAKAGGRNRVCRL